MHLCFFALVSFFTFTFGLPNGIEVKVPPPKSEYSDWYDIFYKQSSIIPLFRSKEKVYFIGKHFRVNFLQAHLFCKIMHMNLMTIQSKEETDEIKTILQKNGITGDFWTSATRMFDGKTWIWMSTAKPVQYTNWSPGHPNNQNDHCILAIRTRTGLIYWNNRNCNCRSFFICEKPFDETVLYVSSKQESGIRKYYRNYFD
ncbi:perlucin-like [Anoplophora glabripennis]|uniref:perlucin-like n=1 Tax=Anoplophora glabripennis TaxID=217634 RepID=UPI000873FD39|nr:perlucin-like [Anoplophora glabripennis]